MLVRCPKGTIHHIEFQYTLEPGFARRMFHDYIRLEMRYGRHIHQTVLYVGPPGRRLEREYRSPSLRFKFDVINVREMDAAELLASDDWPDLVPAQLAKGVRGTKAVDAAIRKLRQMTPEDRGPAIATYLVFSAIWATKTRSEKNAGVRHD